MIIGGAPQGASAIFGLLGSMLLARGLTPSEFGVYNLLIGFVMLICSFTDVGINNTAIRYASKYYSLQNTKQFLSILHWAMRWRTFLAIVFSGFVLLWGNYIFRNFWNYDVGQIELGCVVLSILCSALSSVPIIYFQTTQEFVKYGIFQSLQYVLVFIGIFFCYQLQFLDASLYFVGYGFSWLVFLFISLFVGNKDIWLGFLSGLSLKFPDLYDDGDFGQVFAFKMMLINVVSIVTTRLDVFLIASYLSVKDLGNYSVALKVAMPITMLLAVLETIFWPKFSSLTSRHDVLAYMKRIYKIFVVVLIFLVVYSFLAPYFISGVFGEQYKGLYWLGVLVCLRWVISVAFKPIDFAGYSFKSINVNIFVNIINFFVITFVSVFALGRLGPMASVLASMVMATFAGMASFWVIYRNKSKMLEKI